MEDCLSETTLVRFFAGGLPVDRVMDVEQHLDACPACAALLDVAAPMLAGASDRPLAWGLPREAEPGALIADRYRVHSVIGCGASGYVLRAQDELAGTPVAVKLLRPERAGEPVMVEQLTRELRVARALNHPHVCRIFDLQTSGESRFLVMELARCSLADELRDTRAGDRPLPARLDDAEAITAGLVAIHAAGVIHRDVKPGNVLRLQDGRLVVSDFGLASLTPQGSATRFVGTPLYMAPEVAAGEQATRASDLFSLGLVLHELFFGCRPQWRSRSGRRLFELPAGVRGSRERALARLCADCLALGPQERPPEASGILRRLRSIRAGATMFRYPALWQARVAALLLLPGSLVFLHSAGILRLQWPEPHAPAPLPLARGDWAGVTSWVVSAAPRSPVPIPKLPRDLVVEDRERLARICLEVEGQTVYAGVSPEFAHGILETLQRVVRVGEIVHPVAMYYSIVREAALRNDRTAAAANLAAAHSTGRIRTLRNLPAVQP